MIDLLQLRNRKQIINREIENGNIEEAEILILEYEKMYKYDLDIKILKAIIYFYQNKYKEAEIILRKLYDKFEYNYEVNCNLGIILLKQKSYEESIYYLLKSSIIDQERWKKEEIFRWIVEIPNEIYNKVKNNTTKILQSEFNSSQKLFFGWNHVGRKIDFGYKNKYYIGVDDKYIPERDGIFLEENEIFKMCYKIEMIRAEEVEKKIIKAEEKLVVPLMINESFQNINIKVNEKDNIMKNLIKNRYYYYTFNKGDEIVIDSERLFIVGDEVTVKKDKNKPSLVLNIFIDGFSQKFLRENGMKNIAPNIYEFFSQGTICDNFYVNGDWTYTSLASIFTGKSTANHRIYHPSLSTHNLKCQEIYSEVFKKQGYFTAMINGDWRSNPSIGYIKGIDRYLYQPAVRGMKVDDVLTETIEHLMAFKDLNNFVWIGIPDLHDIVDEFQTGISNRIATSIEGNTIEQTKEKTVSKSMSKSKIERYKNEITRIDTYLGLLFSYINKNYDNDDIVVSLFTDHGQSFIDNGKRYLDERRSNGVFMIRGRNIKQQQTDELISGVDLFPIELNACGISNYDIKEGNIPKCFGGKSQREFVYTETIYPDKFYEAVINNKTHKFFFNSKELCTLDGRVKLDEYDSILINKSTEKDETDMYPNEVKKYTDEVFNHIKEMIII